LDLDGVEPMSHVLDLPNVFRDDISSESLSVKQALENAPNKNETFFKVPKVME
jgi:aspartyl/glutamyl-tRNA(Asn/Gln) amidotransferase C subunit